MIKKFFSFLGLMLTLSLFSFLLVLGGEERPKAAPSAAQSAAGYVSSHDLAFLASHIGASVPYLSPNGHGQVEDVPFADGYAQLLTFTDENSITIRCIRPAAAAAYLRDDALSPSGEYCTLDGMTAAIFKGDQRYALHFGNEDVAYAIFRSGQVEEFLPYIDSIAFTQ